MSDDPKDPKGDEWDRMSLNSLKRELEIQKAKTEMARDEATERIREKSESSSGRSWMWMVGAILLVLVAGFAISMTIPSVRDWQFELVTGDYDAGPGVDAAMPERPDAGPGEVAQPMRHPMRHMNMTMMTTDGLDFGDDDDPIGGLE